MNFTAAIMHGKIWMPIDELIEFFEEGSTIEGNEFRQLDKFTAMSLTAIKEKCCKEPTRVMTEEEFLEEKQ